MSSANNSTRATPSPLTSNGVQPKSTTGIIPTNNVTTKAGVTVRARIDPTLTVEDVVRQLCLHLKVTEPHTTLALRDRDTEELITSENLRKKIKNKVHLKLVNSSAIEAAGIVAKLSLREEKSLRMSLFSLQRFIKEEKFAQEFLDRDGLRELVDVIETAHGNTLAYALTAMQNLMDLDYGWSTLDDSFIFKVVQILSSPNSLINVCRPATAILKKLVEADPTSVPGPIIASSSRIPPVAPAGSVYRYGFQSVYEQMRRQKGSLETVVSRLGSPDTAMAQHSVMLINSLLSHVNDTYWDEFIADLERLNVRKAIIRLMSSHVDDLTSCVLDFQANIVRVTYRKKTTLVEPEVELAHLSALHYIWECSGVQEGLDSEGHPSKWRRLGFDSENIVEEFQDAGVLGLDCLVNFVQDDPDFFSKVILEQLSRPEERRCPVAKASNEVVELLSQHWTIFAPAYSTSAFQPLFLNFQKVHCLALHFFLRMWNESGSAVDDFNRIADLTRSQIKVALQQESAKPWHEVEHDFLEREYRAVRDRQMQELEAGDDLLSRVPVRAFISNLKEKLTRESAEFVRQQRIHCLLQGAWFLNGVPTQHTGSARRPNGQWRFMRLDNGLKYLHYVDSSAKIDVRNGTEDLPERIEIASINQITTGTCAPLPNLARDHPDIPTTLLPSPLSFSLLSAGGESLADQIATHQSRWADWTDGLNMLRRDSGHVTSEETAGYIKALTEIGLKIKLLDLSGEKVDIPSGLVAGPPPTNTDFFFSDLL